jgi:hypothetical protein
VLGRVLPMLKFRVDGVEAVCLCLVSDIKRSL